MPNLTPIPFIDLAPELAKQRSQIDEAIRRVLDSGRFLLGEELAIFETEFAEYNGATCAVGVASGLAALTLMLRAFGVGSGDEVIVPANTYIATWLAVSAVGAKPVPVEPDLLTRNIDHTQISKAVTARTKAVLAVHLYGMPCDMDALETICRQNNLWLLVDAAQSCGTTWNGSRTKCLGDAAAFSFYPTKNLGALGDAGAVVTNDSARAEQIKLLRNYGMDTHYQHELKGINARMDELQAAVLRVRLANLNQANNQRKQLATCYQRCFTETKEIVLQQQLPPADSSWHLFTVSVPERDNIKIDLEEQGFGVAVHYPVPPHRSGAYRNEPGGWPELPVTDFLAGSLLSLPIYPGLKKQHAERVATALIRALSERKTHERTS